MQQPVIAVRPGIGRQRVEQHEVAPVHAHDAPDEIHPSGHVRRCVGARASICGELGIVGHAAEQRPLEPATHLSEGGVALAIDEHDVLTPAPTPRS